MAIVELPESDNGSLSHLNIREKINELIVSVNGTNTALSENAHINVVRSFNWLVSNSSYVALPFNIVNVESNPSVIEQNPADETEILIHKDGFYKAQITLNAAYHLHLQLRVNGVDMDQGYRELGSDASSSIRSQTILVGADLLAGDILTFHFRKTAGSNNVDILPYTEGYIRRLEI